MLIDTLRVMRKSHRPLEPRLTWLFLFGMAVLHFVGAARRLRLRPPAHAAAGARGRGVSRSGRGPPALAGGPFQVSEY